MTACFDTLSIVTKEDIASALAASDDECIAVSYNTGDTEQYNRKKTPDSVIITKIYNYIRQIQTALSETLNDLEPDEETLNAMYRQYLAEQDSFGDAEEAILHHYCA